MWLSDASSSSTSGSTATEPRTITYQPGREAGGEEGREDVLGRKQVSLRTYTSRQKGEDGDAKRLSRWEGGRKRRKERLARRDERGAGASAWVWS
jgi:hypothetical protein